LITKDKLFFVDINEERNRLLALELEFRSEEDGKTRVSFYDTNRGRGFYGELISEKEDEIVFRTDSGDMMTFRLATIKEYDQEWRRYIEGSVPKFLTDEELYKWYYKQFFG
jgi:hypothetical protein